MTKILLLLLVACGSPPRSRPDTIYHPRARGAIDLADNPNARHCSELTGDFRDAYGLEAGVQTIHSIAVAADASRAVLRANGGEVPASLLIDDRARLRAFWRYDDWTLAVVLDHGSCRDDVCAAEIALIKYNGALLSTERTTKLCFERWVGTFARVPEIRSARR